MNCVVVVVVVVVAMMLPQLESTSLRGGGKGKRREGRKKKEMCGWLSKAETRFSGEGPGDWSEGSRRPSVRSKQQLRSKANDDRPINARNLPRIP